jgi:hypothetical protein
LPHRGLAIDVRAALGPNAEPWLLRALGQMLEPNPDTRAHRVPAPGSGRRRVESRAEDWRTVRDRGREERRQLRDESRRLRRELKKEAREATRHLRHRDWTPRHELSPLAPLLVAAVAVALMVARVATFWLFRVLLPLLLGVLSLFFGRPLRRAAYRVREVGIAGDQGLRHALGAVRQRLLTAPEAPDNRERTRIDEDELDFDVPSEPAGRASRRA